MNNNQQKEERLTKACKAFLDRIMDLSENNENGTVFLEARVDDGGLRYVVLRRFKGIRKIEEW